MLAQILRDMYIDPVMLAGLDETQKQTLFCKMREEQIRRWRIWDQSFRPEDDDERVECRRAVRFLQGEDGEPWVWVMGEHLNDRSIDEILADEAKQRAREMAEIETKEFRKSYVAEMSSAVDLNSEYDSDTSSLTSTTSTTSTTKASTKETTNDDDAPQIDEMEIYCSVDELRERIQEQKYNALNNMAKKPTAVPTSRPTIGEKFISPIASTPPRIKQFPNNAYAARLVNFNLTSSQPIVPGEVLKEISTNKPTQKVSAKIALWEKRVIGEATNEIYRRLQRRQQETAIEAEEAARKREELWQEQERRAKEAEVQMREIARRAREEHRKSINCEQQQQQKLSSSSGSESSSSQQNSSPPSSLDSNISRPPSQEAVVQWYETDEYGRGCGIDPDTGRPYRWFHGLVRRIDAEHRLANEPAGTFLVRLSEKIWGYAISYKDTDRCKHYLVDATNGTYQFLGANQLNHNSLSESLILFNFHFKSFINRGKI